MAEALALRDEEPHLISKGLYSTLSKIIGTESIIKLRRQYSFVVEFYTSMNVNALGSKYPLVTIYSGSKGEGFDFRSSDVDMMAIDTGKMVLNDRFVWLYNYMDTCSPSILVMDTENAAPGFAFLRTLRLEHDDIRCIGHIHYFESKLIRDVISRNPSTRLHGPCSSFTCIQNGLEIDSALTFQCPVWPSPAMSFIYRSLHYGWPRFDVLADICKDGCLLVPIQSKQQTFREQADVEWRISFSLAEKKLVHSMNHCQFLAYGLMKIFLNEVLKKIPEVGELLCSYFMKTAVFWEISEWSNNWTTSHFIDKFLNIFKRILKWVALGYCPNYFIIQHNMFYGKIYGNRQRSLMLRLRTLHEDGYMCLLHCTSLYPNFAAVINYPLAFTLKSNRDKCYVPLAEQECSKIGMMIDSINLVYSGHGVYAFKTILHKVCLWKTASDIMTASKRLQINLIIQNIALKLQLNEKQTMNKINYVSIKTSQSMLRRSKTFCCLNEIHRAACSYINGQYNKTKLIIHDIKEKFQGPPYMYAWTLYPEIIMECRQHGMTYDDIIKTFIIHYYQSESAVVIEELYLEAYFSQDLVLPPHVFVNFLLLLCHTRLYETNKRSDVLYELGTLVNDDDRRHMGPLCQAMPWEVLGICQQICGDKQSAYKSFIYALNSKDNSFKEATILRIYSLFQD